MFLKYEGGHFTDSKLKVERDFTIPWSVRPATGLTVGVFLVQRLPELPGAWSLVALGLGLLLAAYRRWVWLAACLFGMLWALIWAGWRLAETLPNPAARQQAVIEALILDLPKPMERGLRFDVQVDRVLEPAATALPHRLRLSWYHTDATPKAGERWRFQVKLRAPRGQANPGGFDYEQWLFAENLRAVGYVRNSAMNQRLAAGAALSPGVWRQMIHDRLATALAASPRAGLIQALTLGVDDAITAQQWEVLRNTGTAHLIAISGSHIGLIAALAFVVARAIATRCGFWAPPRLAAGVGLLAAVLYSALAGFSIPTQRALIMVGIAMGAVILQRHTDSLHLLALALLAVVLYDPWAVLAPGFWLSFGAVALIAYGLSNRIAVSRPAPGRIGAALAQGRRALVTLWTINWVTSLGLAPFLIAYFRQIPLVSPLANLLAVPVLGTLLVPLCLFGAVLLPIYPAGGAGCLGVADALLAALWPVLETLADQPWSQWRQAEPPLWTLPPALVGAVWLLAPRGIPARWLGLLLWLPILTLRPERLPVGTFRLTLLDVGQGLAAVVETRHKTLVFDTGPRFGPDFDMGGAVVEPYLRHQGIAHLDTLVVSHGDNDHSGGAASLLRRIGATEVYASDWERLPPKPAPRPCQAGQHWGWDGVDFAMLGPVTIGIKDNDNSCVLQIAGRNGKALLTGDIEQAAEQRLIEHYGEKLRSDILVVPHHGSKTSSSAAFLDRVRPRYALIPAGYLNRFGFPHRAVLERYRAIGSETLNTADWGAIRVEPDGTHPMGYREIRRRYWQEQWIVLPR